VPEITNEQMKSAFDLPSLNTYTNAADFKNYVESIVSENSVLLFMSSGNYGGLDLVEFANNL